MQTAKETREQTFKLILGSLTAISVILLQPLITLTQTDTAATVALIAFAIGIPFTAIGFFINTLAFSMRGTSNEEETIKDKAFGAATVTVVVVGVFGEETGIVAAIWHASQRAGLVFLVCGGIAFYLWSYWDKWLVKQGQRTAK